MGKVTVFLFRARKFSRITLARELRESVMPFDKHACTPPPHSVNEKLFCEWFCNDLFSYRHRITRP